MKALLIFTLFCLQTMAMEGYKFENIQKVDDFDFRREVENRQGYSFIVFNNGHCSYNNPRRCHDFEWKLNHFAPTMTRANPSVKVFNQDIQLNSSYRQYRPRKFPAVVVLKNGGVVKTFEPDVCERLDRNQECHTRRRLWKSKMLQEILDFYHRLPRNQSFF